MHTKNIFYHKFTSIFIFAVALALFGFSAEALAAGSGRVGFVNSKKALISTQEWKKSLAEFNKDAKRKQVIVSAKEKKLKRMLEDLNKQSKVLNSDLKKAKEEKFRKEKVEFERYVQDLDTDFKKKEKEIVEKIGSKLLSMIKKIGKEKNYSMIMDSKSVIYFNPAADITDQVIKAYDRNNK